MTQKEIASTVEDICTSYTIDDIKEAGQMVHVILEENGFTTRTYEIDKITPKQVHFKDDIYFRGLYSKKIDQGHLFNQKLKVGRTSGRGVKTFYISAYALILEKDVEKVKEFFTEEGKKEIQDRINQLQKQLDVLS